MTTRRKKREKKEGKRGKEKAPNGLGRKSA